MGFRFVQKKRHSQEFFFSAEKTDGRIKVYYLPELYQIYSKVASGLCKVQGYKCGHRKSARDDVLGPANVRSRAVISPTHVFGYR